MNREEATMPTRRAFGLLAPAVLATPRRVAAQAETWPDRPVRVVVPFGPGGAIDILIRIMAPHFPARGNGQPLVVENRGGAGGTIGAALAAQARPDGYTLLMAEQASAVLAHELYRNLAYDPRTAFTPIIFLAELPMVLVVRANQPARSLAALLAQARETPGKLSYSTVGVGHISHLTAELLASRAGEGARLLSVIYRSGAEMVAAVARGEIDFTITSLSSAAGFLQAGSIRAMAVSTPQPLASMPEVPTMAATFPGVAASLWYGLVGPAGMPASVVTRVNAACNAILALPEVRDALQRQQGARIVGGTAEQFARHLTTERERWTPVLHAAGVKAE
jgi:tripartite-type tricarboxylate transporter receptor subunit TctC